MTTDEKLNFSNNLDASSISNIFSRVRFLKNFIKYSEKTFQNELF